MASTRQELYKHLKLWHEVKVLKKVRGDNNKQHKDYIKQGGKTTPKQTNNHKQKQNNLQQMNVSANHNALDNIK